MDSGEVDRLIVELAKTTARLGEAASAISAAAKPSEGEAVSSTVSRSNRGIVTDKPDSVLDVDRLLEGFEKILGRQFVKDSKADENRDKKEKKEQEAQNSSPRRIQQKATPVTLVGINKGVINQLVKAFGSISNIPSKVEKPVSSDTSTGFDWKSLGLGALALALAPISAMMGFFEEIGKQKWFKAIAAKIKKGTLFKDIKLFFTGTLDKTSRLFRRIGKALKLDIIFKPIRNFFAKGGLLRTTSTYFRDIGKALKLDTIFRPIRNFFTKGGTLAKTSALFKGMTEAEPVKPSKWKAIKDFFRGKGGKPGGVMARISRFFGKIQPHIKKGLDVVKNMKITRVAKLLGAGLGKLAYPLTVLLSVVEFVQGFREGLEEDGIVEGVKQGLLNVVDFLVFGLVDMAGWLVTGALDLLGFSNTADSIQTLLDEGKEFINQYIGGAVDFIGGIFTFDGEKMWDGLGNMMDGQKNLVGWVLDLAVNPVVNFFRDLFNMDGEFKFTEWSGFDKIPNPKELFENAWKNAGAVFTNYMETHPYMKEKWDALKNGVSNFANDIKDKWNKFSEDPGGTLKKMGGKVMEFAGDLSYNFQQFIADPKQGFENLKGKVADAASDLKAGFDEFLEGSGAKAKWEEIKGSVSEGVDKIKAGWANFTDGASKKWESIKGAVSKGAKDISDAWNAFRADPKKAWEGIQGKFAEGASWMGDQISAAKKAAKAKWDQLGAMFSGPVDWMKKKFEEGRKKAEMREKRAELIKELKLDPKATDADIQAEIKKRQALESKVLDRDSELSKSASAAGINLEGVGNSEELASRLIDRANTAKERSLAKFIDKYTLKTSDGGGYLDYDPFGWKGDMLVKIGGKSKGTSGKWITNIDELYEFLNTKGVADNIYKATTKDGKIVKAERNYGGGAIGLGKSVLDQQQQEFGKATKSKDVISNIAKVSGDSPLFALAESLGLDSDKLRNNSEEGILRKISEKINASQDPELMKSIKEYESLKGVKLMTPMPQATPVLPDTTAVPTETIDNSSAQIMNANNEQNTKLVSNLEELIEVTRENKPQQGLQVASSNNTTINNTGEPRSVRDSMVSPG